MSINDKLVWNKEDVIMKRAIKFKLKNGKVVTIRRMRGDDYDAAMRYMDKFAHGPSAKWTYQYAGQPKKDREKSIAMYESPDNIFIAAWDGDQIIGMANANKIRPNHPYSARSAITGTTMLEKYTSNGLGNKFKQIVEKWARENNVHKLETSVRHKNVRSLGNLIKNGYQIVGIMHDTAFIDGEWHHEYLLEKILEK